MFLRRFALCLLVLSGFLTATRAAEPVKVGILGFDNYQAVEYAAFFNNPKAEVMSTIRIAVAESPP